MSSDKPARSGKNKDNMRPLHLTLTLLATVASAATFVTEGATCPDRNNDWLWWLLIWISGLLFLLLLTAAVFLFIRKRRPTIDTYAEYGVVISPP